MISQSEQTIAADARGDLEPLPFPAPQVVAITAVAGNLGQVLAKLLHTKTRILGFDQRPYLEKPKDIEHYPLDIRKRKVEDVFRRRRPEALIHLGILYNPRMPFSEVHNFNLVGTQKVLELCVRFGVKKVVVLSSANLYGPSPNNPNFLPEETPLMAADPFSGVRDLIELDMYAQSFVWKHPEIETVILRFVNIIGPTVHNPPSSYLRLSRPITVLGFDPMVQLIHEKDACRALALALKPGVRGIYNVTGPGEVPLSTVLRELGKKPLPVPHFLIRSLLRRAFSARLSHFPPNDVDHIQYLCTVDGSRAARDFGWMPIYSLREAIRSVLEGW